MPITYDTFVIGNPDTGQYVTDYEESAGHFTIGSLDLAMCISNLKVAVTIGNIARKHPETAEMTVLPATVTLSLKLRQGG